MAVQIIVKNSSVEDKRPTAPQLANGEIALNYNEAGAFLTCKDTNGDIQQVGGVKINDVAPDSPPIQCLWFQPSSLTLFVYDGNSWLPVAGGGGGGGGGDITQIIGNQGIDANEIAGIVTLDVELDGTNCGLKFNSSKLSAEIATDSRLGSVKIGNGIDVAIDGTISVDIPQTLTFRGSVDLNNPPSGQITPDPALAGDAYVVTLTAPSVATGWTGIVGDTANAGDLVVFDGTNWELIATGGTMQAVEGGDGIQASTAAGVATVAVDLANTDAGLEFDSTDVNNVKLKASIASDTQLGSVKVGDGLSATAGGVLSVDGAPDLSDGDGATFDGRYVKIVGDATAQTITGTGGLKTEGLLESAGGVEVSGASADGFAYFTDQTNPNYYAGSTYIGGTTARNTLELWKSTLTEEQLEQLEAGTLVAPANVSLPGDGSFARQWYYDQQDEETQALLDSGELEYPTHLAAATFTDTFALGDNTKINLNSNGSSSFALDATIHGLTVGRGAGAISSNTAFGGGALNANTTGINNTATGRDALQSNTTGNYNTATGQNALFGNTIGENNTAVGHQALRSNVLINAIDIDSGTTYAIESVGTTDFTVIGAADNNIGTTFTATGPGTGTGTVRTRITGSDNTAVGRGALYSNTTGSNNTATGRVALFNNTTGINNTATGRGALQSNTEGFGNTATGRDALFGNTTGNNNTAIGLNAGVFQQTGTVASDFDNCTYLGHDTRASGSNQVQLGDTTTTTFAYGAVQDRSDARDKTDIRDTLLGLDFVNSLRPVDFRWDYRDDYFDKEEYQEEEVRISKVFNPDYVVDGDEPEFIEEEYTETVTKQRLVPVTKDGSRSRDRFHHGLIAQEVKAAADAQGVDFAGYQDHSVNGGLDVLSIGYTEMIAPLIKAVQELSAENAELKKRLDDAGL